MIHAPFPSWFLSVVLTTPTRLSYFQRRLDLGVLRITKLLVNASSRALYDEETRRGTQQEGKGRTASEGVRDAVA